MQNLYEMPELEDGTGTTQMLNSHQGFALVKLTPELMDELDRIDVAARENPDNFKSHADQLVGTIDKELSVDLNADFANFVINFASQLDARIGHVAAARANMIGHNLVMRPTFDDNWVNYQKKHDFNPPHRHTGAYSYVVWHTIPYDIDDELEAVPEGKESRNAAFAFMFNNGADLSEVYFRVSKEHQGYMAIFPSNLTHFVTPFYTSDEYRVSFSGNILFTPVPVDDASS